LNFGFYWWMGILCSLLFPIDSFLFCIWMDSPALCRRCCFVLFCVPLVIRSFWMHSFSFS
jgi:hypothetical protein